MLKIPKKINNNRNEILRQLFENQKIIEIYDDLKNGKLVCRKNYELIKKYIRISFPITNLKYSFIDHFCRTEKVPKKYRLIEIEHRYFFYFDKRSDLELNQNQFILLFLHNYLLSENLYKEFITLGD